MFKFRPERLDEETLLGKGASGEVFPYQKDPQDKRWVVKRILAKNTDDLLHCFPEIVLGFTCDHPCVVPVKGYFVEKVPNSKYFHVYMKIPRMKETLFQSFKDRKKRNEPFTEKEIIQHFYSLACGIKYLHQKKIYHGDIRHDNLLLDEQGNLKIADVGLAKNVVEEEDSYQAMTGTSFSSAPEILGEKLKKTQFSKADIWSLGVVVLELCTFDYRLLNSSLPQDKLQSRLNEFLTSLEEKYSKEFIELIRRLLSIDPKERPDIGEIKDYLEENFSESINNKNSCLKKDESGDQISVSEKEQITKILKNFEAEKSQLKEIITQLEKDLAQQKLQYEEIIKAHINGNAKEQTPQMKDEDYQRLQASIPQKDKQQQSISFEEQIRNLYQSRMSPEQRSKELENYIKTTAKEQIRAYEKNLLESQRKEKAQNNVGEEKRESFGADYKKNLMRVVSLLDEGHSKWFRFEAVDNQKLQIIPRNCEVTDFHVSFLAKDLVEKLYENDLFNLSSLHISFWNCRKLTDKALEDIAVALSRQSLQFQHLALYFGKIPSITDRGVETLVTGIEKSCQNLQELSLSFSNSEKVTEKKIESIRRRFVNVPKLRIL